MQCIYFFCSISVTKLLDFVMTLKSFRFFSTMTQVAFCGLLQESLFKLCSVKTSLQTLIVINNHSRGGVTFS